jgi:hypothetical protein
MPDDHWPWATDTTTGEATGTATDMTKKRRRERGELRTEGNERQAQEQTQTRSVRSACAHPVRIAYALPWALAQRAPCPRILRSAEALCLVVLRRCLRVRHGLTGAPRERAQGHRRATRRGTWPPKLLGMGSGRRAHPRSRCLALLPLLGGHNPCVSTDNHPLRAARKKRRWWLVLSVLRRGSVPTGTDSQGGGG